MESFSLPLNPSAAAPSGRMRRSRSGQGRSGKRRRSSRPAGNTPLPGALSQGVVATILLAVFALVLLRQRFNSVSGENLSVIGALVMAVVAIVFLHGGVQQRLARWGKDRADARERKFWRDRDVRERHQQAVQDQLDAARAQQGTGGSDDSHSSH